MVFPYWLQVAALASLLSPAWAGEPYPEHEEVCVAACEHTLDLQTFIPVEASDEAYAQTCQNILHAQSVYICAKQRCEQRDVEPGWGFLSHLCNDEGFPALPSLQSFSDVSADVAKPINSTSKNKKLNTAVLADDKFWDLVLESTTARAQARWINRSHQHAIYIFWGIIMGLAAMFNLGAKFSVDAPAFASRILRPVRANLSIPPLFTRSAQAAPSRLEALVIFAFFALSVVLCAVSIEPFPESWIYVSYKKKSDQAQILSLIGRRFSDMALANLAIIWLFSMRNNPLILITGWSFATFNQFHRWIARITFLELIIHASVFTKYQFVKGGLTRYKYVFQELQWWVMAVVAIVFLSLLVGSAAAPFRPRFYDTFLLMHILLAVVFFATLWYHIQAQFFLPSLWPIVAIWSLERLLRIVRLFITGAKGIVRVSADSSAGLLRIDASSIVGKRQPTPGSTYYIAPADSTGVEVEKQTDNVTVQQVSTPSEQLNYRFLIAPQKGFTGRLQNYVAKTGNVNGEELPYQRVPVFLEGPYQDELRSINFHSCRDILLVIGGSGISVALSSIYRALSIHKVSSVTLVWSVRRWAMIHSVANEELQSALRDSRFSLKG
ncbi:ferric-chelate reductase [Diaporthe australafricana]|uniref:Ferric-chelate reductase n=1 Tax=Diaporthe australafricana TaxID=127596 RepID=A0ABR3X0B2_9PEZI